MTIIPDSTAVRIASRTAPAKPTPPRLIDTTSQPDWRARSIATPRSPSNTCTTLFTVRSGTSVTPGRSPLDHAGRTARDGARSARAMARRVERPQPAAARERVVGVGLVVDDVPRARQVERVRLELRVVGEARVGVAH